MFFSIALLSMILITSQSPVAFAGAGIWEDKDNDGYSTEQGDCDDNDPNVYPVDGLCVTTIEIDYDVKVSIPFVKRFPNTLPASISRTPSAPETTMSTFP